MRVRRILPAGLFLLLLAVSLGCAGGQHHFLVPDYGSRTPRSVAVLPVMNETVSLKAPEAFRPILLSRLSSKGYETPALSSIDGRLAGRGIYEAGQIHALAPQELGRLLGVDALLYTTVTEFNTTTHFRDRISNLEPLLASLQRSHPDARLVVLLDRDEQSMLDRLQDRFTVHSTLYYPLDMDSLVDQLEQQARTKDREET